ncbi:hypothetical protein GCM10017600_64050 [Streptosporangium carneum]|uniref:Uncharacterized protein n=1 Tax=Streptosporangium carneum TaxID=47481 RepID=A0A9W6I8Q5_9ACTN|nr:hypothetical protein GCM10017600_64050 [Streptosporangium carneum]
MGHIQQGGVWISRRVTLFLQVKRLVSAAVGSAPVCRPDDPHAVIGLVRVPYPLSGGVTRTSDSTTTFRANRKVVACLLERSSGPTNRDLKAIQPFDHIEPGIGDSVAFADR